MRAIGIGFVAVIVSMSTAAEPETATPPAPAAPTPPSKCIYNNAIYTQGAVICVGPQFGQSCGNTGSWNDLSNAAGSFKEACANAQFTSPGAVEPPAIPAKCTYHDVTYTNGAVICIGPKFGQTCNPNGSWSDFSRNAGTFAAACKDAQVPSPTGGSPATGGTTPTGKGS